MKMKILVVEDDDHLREVLLEAAIMEGYLAAGVPSAEAAIDCLEAESFDVIVTDITLPGMSGLDLLKHCSHQQSLITVVITAYGK
jgi:DNA-binding NtrC family response regulator